MRGVERTIERVSPTLGARLRLLRKRLRHDMTLRVIGQLVHPGDHVLDLGAYRGVYTMALTRRVGPGGRVWAVEPFPPNAATVARVVRRQANVTVCAWAASAEPGRRTLTVPVYEGRALGALATLGELDVPSQSVSIESRTVDDLFDDADARPLSFIRCDVVGHEAAALRGANGCLRRDRPALFVEIEQRHQEAPIQATFDHLQGLGYDGYFLRAGTFFPLESFDPERDQLSFLTSSFVPYGMPAGYVHYFLFVRPETDLGPLPLG
jgi:FkbM family methyltransferase